LEFTPDARVDKADGEQVEDYAEMLENGDTDALRKVVRESLPPELRAVFEESLS